MSTETTKTDKNLIGLIVQLKTKSIADKAGLWKAVALHLEKPTRRRAQVNLSKINKFTKDKETIVVPGKVLSSGDIDHSITVAAFNFSAAAKEKISKKGQAISIDELLAKNPKAKDIRIIT